MAEDKNKKKKEPIQYILNGEKYQLKDITFKLICEDIASRKDTKAKAYIMENKDKNFLSLRKEYLEKWGKKADTEKDEALALLNW